MRARFLIFSVNWEIGQCCGEGGMAASLAPNQIAKIRTFGTCCCWCCFEKHCEIHVL
jgi:hypothetical protein